MEKARSANDEMTLALDHLRKAITLLDEVSAPAHIGAYVDLAMHRLQEVIGSDLTEAE